MLKLSITKVLISYNIWIYNLILKGAYSKTSNLKLNLSLNWNSLNQSFFILCKFSLSTLSKFIFYTLFKFLKENSLCQFNNLIDVVGLPVNNNLESSLKKQPIVSYNLLSITFNYRLVVLYYTLIKESNLKFSNEYNFFTICDIFYNAHWYEREIYDMYGYVAIGNKDLSRILTDYGFKGHPLKKNYPSVGFIETIYNDSTKRISYKKVELSQAYRSFKIGRIKKKQWKSLSI